MRLLLTVFLIVAGCVNMAHAAPPCYPGSSASQNFETTTFPNPAEFLFGDNPNEAAFVVTWFCDEVYRWKGYGWVGWRRNLVPDWQGIAAQLRGAPKTAQDAAWAQYIKCDFDAGPCPEHDALKPIIDRQFKATKPAPIIWQVRDNPSATSRPVFAVNANGTRNTTAVPNQRVSDVSTDCGCTARAIEETGGVYCSMAGVPNVATADPADVIPADRVALCFRTN